MSELKKCPFCGGDNIGEEVNGEWKGKVCSDCGASGKWDLGWSGAIEMWNTRPLEDALQAKLNNELKVKVQIINELDKIQLKLAIAMKAYELIKSLVMIESEEDSELWDRAQEIISRLEEK